MTLRNVCIILAVLIFVSGCGGGGRKYSKTEMVEGLVTLDGVPIEGADITFFPKGTGESATGKTDAEGRYKLTSINGAPDKGTTVGEYGITASQWVVKKLDEPYIDKAQDALIEYDSKEMLPVVYTEIHTSPLKATVNAGPNTINLELDSKAR